MPSTQQNCEIEIITPLGADVLLLREMTVTEELGRLFSINVELDSTEDIDFEKLLGQNVSIRLNLVQGKRFFNGFVTSISQGASEGRFARYSVMIHPWLWFLTRTSDCRIFQNKTIPDIIKEVLKEHGFSDIVSRLKGSYRTWDYCVQYRETDFNFISRLMEQEGIYYYFMHEQAKHTLYLADDLASHDKLPSGYVIPYYPPDQAVTREEECISSWRITKQIQSGAYCLNDYDYENPKADLSASSHIVRNHSKANLEVYDYPGEYLKYGDGSNYAKIRIQELQHQFECMQGQGNVRGLICGGLLKLNLFPRSDQNREYLVTSVTHNIRVASFESTTGDGGNLYNNYFTVIDSNTPYRSARVTPKPFIQGSQTAEIVGPSGEEIYTDDQGRVKLQFHWDRYGRHNENSSCFMRVSQVHAGKGFGGIDIPRIGEEVIVNFLEGNPDRPIIIGRVYNGENRAPNGLPAQKMVSGLQSNSTPGGGGNNSIMLNDTKGKEQLAINGQHNMDTTVGNDQSNKINNNRKTEVGVDDDQSVGSNRKVDIGSNLKESIGANLTSFVASDQSKTIGGRQSEIVGASSTISVAGKRIETVGGAHTINNPKMATNVGGKYKVNAGGSITESSPKVSMQAGSKFSATSGGPVNVKAASKIKQEAGSSFNIKGAAINEESKGAFNIKASGALKQQGANINLKGPTKVAGKTKITSETKIKGNTLVVS